MLQENQSTVKDIDDRLLTDDCFVCDLCGMVIMPGENFTANDDGSCHDTCVEEEGYWPDEFDQENWLYLDILNDY
jgi:hypothetical protein